MRKIRDLWVLIHPNYNEHLKPEDVETYKRIIDMVAKSPSSAMVMVPSNVKPINEGDKVEDELARYLRERIPKERRAVYPKEEFSELKRRVTQKTRVLPFGTYAAGCILFNGAQVSAAFGIPPENIRPLTRYSIHRSIPSKKTEMTGLHRDASNWQYYRKGLRSYDIPFKKVPSFEGKLRRVRNK